MKIFVSYTNSDRKWANWIGWHLRDAGHEPFLHEWEVQAGENIARWMEERVQQADRLLGVFSDDYCGALYSQSERWAAYWNDPAGRNGFLVPVEVRNVSVWPVFIKPLRRLSLVGHDESRAKKMLIDFLEPPRGPIRRPRFPGGSGPSSPGSKRRSPSGIGAPPVRSPSSRSASFMQGSKPIDARAPNFPEVTEGANFSKRRDVERWLHGKPMRWAEVIVARSLLRAAPMLIGLFHEVAEAVRLGSTSTFLGAFRSMADLWPNVPEPTSRLGLSKAIHNGLRVLWIARSADTAAARVVHAHTYLAMSADARMLDQGISTSGLLRMPLWPDGEPDWVRRRWFRMKRALLDTEENWEVWTEWYEARLEGRSANETLEAARVAIAEEIWEQGPTAVNAEIGRLIEEYGRSPSKPALPAIPPQRPAAVEPIWLNGRLTLSKKPAKADFDKRRFKAALSALRAELRELVDDVGAEANIDKRPVAFLRRFAERIPETMPQQDDLFRLGHVEAIFAGYAKTVDQEWPDFLASRYHAVSLQFDRTLRQAPLWREFKRNAAKETLSAAQVDNSMSLARETASALQQGEAASFVDPAIARSLEQLADALPVAKAGQEPPPDAIEAGKELLAADLVESVNNTLKPIAEVALSSAGDYAEGFGKGFKKAAKKQGPIDGEKAFKWLRRLALGGGAGAGSFVALSNLIAKFPEAFGWLERVLHVLK